MCVTTKNIYIVVGAIIVASWPPKGEGIYFTHPHKAIFSLSATQPETHISGGVVADFAMNQSCTNNPALSLFLAQVLLTEKSQASSVIRMNKHQSLWCWLCE